MPIDLKQRRKEQEQRVQAMLAQRPGTDTLAPSKEIAGYRQNFLSKVAPNLGGFAKESFARVTPGLEQQTKQNQVMAKSRAVRTNINQVFNYAFNRLVQAGMDERSAYAQARQLALDKQNQQFEAEQAEQSRRVANTGEDIQDFYANQRQAAIRKSQEEQQKGLMKQALISSLFGLGGAVAGGLVAGPVGASLGAQGGGLFSNLFQKKGG